MIVVIDGLGGSIGCEVITRLRKSLGDKIEIVGLATNAVAASKMLKAGANKAASGENAFRVNLGDANLIVGSVGILVPNSMCGELTPQMAQMVAANAAKKILLPISSEDTIIAGLKKSPLPHLMDEVVSLVKKYQAPNYK